MDFEQLWDSKKFGFRVDGLINKIKTFNKKTPASVIAEESKEYFRELVEYCAPSSVMAPPAQTPEPAMPRPETLPQPADGVPESVQIAAGAGNGPATKQISATKEDVANMIRDNLSKGIRKFNIPSIEAKQIKEACRIAGASTNYMHHGFVDTEQGRYETLSF